MKDFTCIWISSINPFSSRKWYSSYPCNCMELLSRWNLSCVSSSIDHRKEAMEAQPKNQIQRLFFFAIHKKLEIIYLRWWLEILGWSLLGQVCASIRCLSQEREIRVNRWPNYISRNQYLSCQVNKFKKYLLELTSSIRLNDFISLSILFSWLSLELVAIHWSTHKWQLLDHCWMWCRLDHAHRIRTPIHESTLSISNQSIQINPFFPLELRCIIIILKGICLTCRKK